MQSLQALGIDIGALVFYLVNFGILVIVLARFLYQPLSQFLEERQELIRKNISEADQMKRSFEEELATLRAQNKTATEELYREIEATKAEARREAEQIRKNAMKEQEEILAHAKEQAMVIKESAERELEAELVSRVEEITTYALNSSLPADQVVARIKSAWRGESAGS